MGGNGKEKGKRHPTIGNNVMISAGAKVLGSFTIGDNVKVGAGAVVITPVPDNCTVVGVPGRIVKRNNVRSPQEDLEQINLPDPVKQEIQDIRKEQQRLMEEIEQMKQKLNQAE